MLSGELREPNVSRKVRSASTASEGASWRMAGRSLTMRSLLVRLAEALQENFHFLRGLQVAGLARRADAALVDLGGTLGAAGARMRLAERLPGGRVARVLVHGLAQVVDRRDEVA